MDEKRNRIAFHPEDSDSDREEEIRYSSSSTRTHGDNDVEMVSFSQNLEAAELCWNDLSCAIGKGKNQKFLLQGVSGSIQGELMAIMGGSGAGKTTLLNALAKRTGSGTKITGNMLLNGSKYNKATLKRSSAYVTQDDLFMGEFTVRETLEFHAKLRLPNLGAVQQQERIMEVIDLLGITHTLGTLVGDPMKKGISGGERKRLAIACEILANPSVLFLDEPTSGLDSTTSLSLVNVLKSLAAIHNITILCTIHQPSSTVFFAFDKLLLLHQGEPVYSGTTKRLIPYYGEAGFSLPELMNPADFMLDVITIDSSSKDETAKSTVRQNVAYLKELYRNKNKQPIVATSSRPVNLKPKAPWLLQFRVLAMRSLVLSFRQPLVVIALILQALIMGEFIGWVWRDLKNNSEEINRKLPLLFFVVVNQGVYGITIMVNLFPAERVVVLHERAAGMYSSSSYFLAKSLAELPLQLLATFLCVIQIYFLTGLRRTAGHFFIFLAFAELAALSALSLSMAISAWSKTATVAATMVPLFVETFRLFGSFFTPPPVIPPYFIWLDAISFVTYALRGISQNELKDLHIECLAEPPATCQYTNGNQLLKSLELTVVPIYACALVLIGLILAFRFIAYLGIRYFKHLL